MEIVLGRMRCPTIFRNVCPSSSSFWRCPSTRCPSTSCTNARTRTALETLLPEVDGEPFYGTASDETAWILGYTDDGAELVAVDLATGERTPLDGPPLMAAAYLGGDETALVGGATVAILDEVFVLADPATGTYTTLPVPYDWHAPYPARDGDRIVTTWGTLDLRSVAVYDLAAEVWRLAADPCGASLTGSYTASRGDEPWVYEYDDAAPGGAWMTRVVVGE